MQVFHKFFRELNIRNGKKFPNHMANLSSKGRIKLKPETKYWFLINTRLDTFNT